MKPPKFMKAASVKKFMKDSKGELMVVKFVKDDGTKREMICKVDIHYKEKNPEPSTKPLPEDSCFVYDTQKLGYRSFKVDKVIDMAMVK